MRVAVMVRWLVRVSAMVMLAVMPAHAQDSTVAGSALEIYLMTMGPGDAIWERFGHNGIGIRDRRAGTDLVYNWGVFDFTEADFLPRFIRGEMRYRVEPYDAGLTVEAYRSGNRSVQVQVLNLTPAQRLAVKSYVEWNALPENKYYRYDYFADNCSTRARDVLDRVLNGAIRAQFGTAPSGESFRDEARRLADADLLYTGIDIGLGRPSDREMTRFEAFFIPMRLRDGVREMQVPDESGLMRPLVASEQNLFVATRAAELQAPVNHQLRYLLVGLVIAAAMALAARLAPGAGRSVMAVWCAIAGVFGLLLIGLWGFTRHVWAYENVNLLHFNPLWFVVAVIAARAAAPAGWRRQLVIVSAALSIVGIVLGLVRWPQHGEQIALLVLAPHLWVASSLLRRKAV